jgi:hypothetical protein
MKCIASTQLPWQLVNSQFLCLIATAVASTPQTASPRPPTSSGAKYQAKIIRRKTKLESELL